MILYTASWSAMGNRHAEGDRSIVPVRISLGKPKFSPIGASAPYVHELAPAGLLGLPHAEFEAGYARRLHLFGIDRIAARLQAIYAEYGRPLALCCFEPWRSDCHRDLAAAWLDLHGLGPVHELAISGAGTTQGPSGGSPASGKTEPAQNEHKRPSGHVPEPRRAAEPAQMSLTDEKNR